MFKQYPHIIEITPSSSTPTLDENGEYVFGDDSVSVEYNCRAQANSGDKTITTADGSTVIYDYLVLLPKMDTTYPPETKVVLKLTETETVEKKIKRQHNTQLNSKIWL